MNTEQAGKLVRVVEHGWPQKDMVPESVVLYIEGLRDLPYEVANRAVGCLLRTDEFRPTIATIRRETFRLAGLMPPALPEALWQAEAYLSWRSEVRFSNGSGWTPPCPPTHKSVVAACEGVPTGDRSWQHVFRAAYREAVEQTERDLVAGTWPTTAGELDE